MSKQPTDWDEALVRAGFVDPRNEAKPSYNQLAQAVGVPQSTISAIVSGRSRRPKPANVQKIADALGVDVRVVSEWVGQERTERAPYAPPAEADLLTDRQRRAVDEIIRAIVAERASGHHGEHDTAGERSRPDTSRVHLAGDAVPDGVTSYSEQRVDEPWTQADFAPAAKRGVNRGKEARRRQDDAGEAPDAPAPDDPA